MLVPNSSAKFIGHHASKVTASSYKNVVQKKKKATPVMKTYLHHDFHSR